MVQKFTNTEAYASHLVDYIYQFIFDSTLKDIC